MGDSEQGDTAVQPENEYLTELPKYKCHKEVHAFKIMSIELDLDKAKEENRETDRSAFLVPAMELGFAPVKVDEKYIRVHEPHVGGYYVVYEDGYTSFSPAEAFEKGYTLIQ